MSFEWSDLGKTIASAAPLLGGVVGGPLGAGVGSIIASVFGVDNDAQAINAAIKSDPNAAVKLREIELNHKSTLEGLSVRQLAIELQDKQDAREKHKDSYMPAVLSCALSLVVTGIIYLLFYSEPPEGSREVLFMLLGVVIKEWGSAMQFWFGTTRSSQAKTVMINSNSK